MGKVVTAEYTCDATNCGSITDDEADAYNIEIRIWSDGTPGVTRLAGVLCDDHAETLKTFITENYLVVSN